ncbi:MAG TPA: CvpA family protein [Anaerolineaceae bacterium]|jgi:uncharacterized membrane protein required for colicin V production
MVSLDAFFWMLVFIFGLVGLMRGWAKEVLVSFSVVLGLFIITLLQQFEPSIIAALAMDNSTTLFWFRVLLIGVLVFFAYQTPNISRLAATNRFVREKLQDSLLGLFLGAVNGFMIVGTMWFFLNAAQYPFPSIISPPAPDSNAAQLLALMPPEWLGIPVIYFAIALAFVFVLVVFV